METPVSAWLLDTQPQTGLRHMKRRKNSRPKLTRRRRFTAITRSDRVKGIAPSYSAWKSDAFARFFNGFSSQIKVMNQPDRQGRAAICSRSLTVACYGVTMLNQKYWFRSAR
jgi:hypothetical protein